MTLFRLWQAIIRDPVELKLSETVTVGVAADTAAELSDDVAVAMDLRKIA